jgi:hypothetical protein
MTRPIVTKELIAATAASFCASNGWDAAQADDLARVCYSQHMDGYELAKALDIERGWLINFDDVETLDCFGTELGEAHRQACIAWARDNNIQPPLPIGTMTTRGEITGISDYDGATYLIKEIGCNQEGRSLLVRFEDARQVLMPLIQSVESAK